jgi:hypothetical protein
MLRPNSRTEQCFNVVHMRSIAQGIKDYHDTLLRMAQVLRPDGVLLLTCASYSFFDEHRRPLASANEGEAGWTASQTLFSAVYDMARCVHIQTQPLSL